MNTLEKEAESYVENILDSETTIAYELEQSFIEGANWQSNEDTVMTGKAIERAIIKHNHSTQETVLKNFRNICGSLNKGKCIIDGKKCTFYNCEALKDLFKE